MDVSSMLTNAQESFRFWAPSANDLNCIEEGDAVKICVNTCIDGKPAVERFWTNVKHVETTDISTSIYASVDNNLVEIDWPVGKLLCFKPFHVYDIIKKESKASGAEDQITL